MNSFETIARSATTDSSGKRNPFYVLGLPPSAKAEQIRSAYEKRLAMLGAYQFDQATQPNEWQMVNGLLKELDEAYAQVHVRGQGGETLPVDKSQGPSEDAADARRISDLLSRGNKHQDGDGVRQDYHEAHDCFHEAAQAGSALAETCLGTLYFYGRGVDQDYTKALLWYEKAAHRGDAFARDQMGWLYQNGWGVAQDDVQAMDWYRKAAPAHAFSQYQVGRLHETGRGVPTDIILAVEWYEKAARQGEPCSQAELRRLTGDGIDVPISHL